MTEQNTAIVIDNGSSSCKAGFSVEDSPQVVISLTDGVLASESPIKSGVITNWDDMEKIWNSIFYEELKVDSNVKPVMLTETPLNSVDNKKKMAEIMFEKFEIPALYLANQCVLSLYASGRKTGIVVDCGYDVSHALPIYDGYAMTPAYQTVDLGGRDITAYLTKILLDRGVQLVTKAEQNIVKDIKEKICYVALDYDAEMAKASEGTSLERNYELPDGNVIKIGSERFRGPQILFHPNLAISGAEGIHQKAYTSIMKSSIDVRKDLYANIVLSGGSTMFPGTAVRMHKEMEKLAPGKIKVKVVAPPERSVSTWIGGSILAALPAFQEMWVTEAEYKESGPSIVFSKLL